MTKSNEHDVHPNNSILKEDLSFLLKNEIRIGVLSSVRLFDTLKLKKIAKLLGKRESTVIHHVKQLEKEGFIQRDEQKRSERGKFYTLTHKGEAFFKLFFQQLLGNEFEKEFNEVKGMTREAYSQRLIDQIDLVLDSESHFSESIQSTAILHCNIVKIITRDIQNFAEDVRRNNIPENEIFRGNIATSLHTIPISTPDHIVKISKLTADYIKRLKLLEKEITEEISAKENYSVNQQGQYVYLFLGPLSKINKGKDIQLIPI